MNSGQALRLSALSPTHGTRAVPRCVGYVSDERVFSLSRSLPSSLSADDVPSLFEWFIGTIPRCDSSQTCTRAVRPEPSPAVLWLCCLHRSLRGLPVLVHEVSRRAVGSSTTPGWMETRAIAPIHVAFRAYLPRRRPGCMFSRLNVPPRLSSIYASLGPSR